MSDFTICFDNMPDGHIDARLDELELLIHEDETHLAFLKNMQCAYWTEKCKRTMKRRPDE